MTLFHDGLSFMCVTRQSWHNDEIAFLVRFARKKNPKVLWAHTIHHVFPNNIKHIKSISSRARAGKTGWPIKLKPAIQIHKYNTRLSGER